MPIPADAEADTTSPAQELARLREAIAFRDSIERIARHDLKAPLGLILQAVDLLLEPGFNPTDDQRKYLGTIRNAGWRMLGLIDLAQRLADIEAGTFTLQPARVDLLTVLGEVTERLRVLIRAQRSDVRVRIDGADPRAGDAVWAHGDRLLTCALLSNLIKNALEATPRGEPVAVLIHPGDPIEIAITNSGAVPDAVRDRLFQKHVSFGKAHGAGLGAYVARRCVEIQGGTIRLDATQPNATTIHITLPRDRSPA